MHSVNPTTAAWINILFLILTGVAAGSVNFAGLPDQTAEIVKSWATNGAFIITCINAVLHLYSAPTAGPMAK